MQSATQTVGNLGGKKKKVSSLKKQITRFSVGERGRWGRQGSCCCCGPRAGHGEAAVGPERPEQQGAGPDHAGP